MTRMFALLGILCALGRFAPYASAQPSDTPLAPAPATTTDTGTVAVPTPTPEAVDYFQSGLLLWGANQVWGIIVPLLILASGLSVRMRNLARRITRRSWLVVIITFALFSLAAFVLDLPLAFYAGFIRQHAYGLSNQTFARWASDALKGLVVATATGALVIWIPYTLMRRTPRRWWLYTGLGAVPFLIFFMLVEPVWIDPWFNDFTRLHDAQLETKILHLAHRAGIDASRVYEVRKSVDTKTVNAYVTGVFGSTRIVLWDNALTRLSERELLVVMGHEMGHYVLGHVWMGLALLAALLLLGLYVVHRALGAAVRRFGARRGLEGIADPAALPLAIIILTLYGMVATPVLLAASRWAEHEADRFALELTRDNHAAAGAFVALQQANLGVPWPGPWSQLLRGSHPSLGARITFCNTYKPWESGAPLKYGDRFTP